MALFSGINYGVQQATINASVEQGIPPSFDGARLFYMMAIFGLMTMSLLTMNWLWRILWRMREDPHPLRSPVTVWRIDTALLLTSALLLGVPDTVLLLRWPEISLPARLALSELDRLLDGVALIPFAAAWFIDYLSRPVIHFQLTRLPPPDADLWPSRQTLLGPAKIAAGSFAVAFAVVYLQ
jgi:hypothetical protein